MMNSIGFILYLIFRKSLGQRHDAVVCPGCQTRISNDVKFCPNCGVNHIQSEIIFTKKPKNYLLVIGIVLITTVFAWAITAILSESSFGSSHSLSATLAITTKWDNQWAMSFHSAKGIGDHTFTVKGVDYGLIYSSEITKGDFKIDFCDAEGNVITEISPNTSDTIKNVENGKKYKIVVTAYKAKGAFSFQMKDLK